MSDHGRVAAFGLLHLSAIAFRELRLSALLATCPSAVAACPETHNEQQDRGIQLLGDSLKVNMNRREAAK
jgi:hypothetical protein